MDTLCKILLLASLVLAAGCIALMRHLHRLKREMQHETEQIQHFLLYPQDPLEESLAEGGLANLRNQISRLEEAVRLQDSAARSREQNMVRFTENMAHQMKNSLTALQIQLDMLELQTRGDTERDTLAKSQACMDRLTQEVDKILKSSQLAEGKIEMHFQTLNVRNALETCRDSVQPIATDRSVEVCVQGLEGLILPADPFWLPQALENVLKNAVEHTAPGTQVAVTLAEEGQKVRILVEDQGPGIPDEELGKLFQRFYRGTSVKAGYGIGLSMAKDIIAAHHGTITARNRECGGAVFEILLPVLEGAGAYPGRPQD